MGYTEAAKRVLAKAYAVKGRQTLALAAALAEEEGFAGEILLRYGVDPNALERELRLCGFAEEEDVRLNRIAAAALRRAKREGEETDTYHLLAALCAESQSLGERALSHQGVEAGRVEDVLRSVAFRFHRLGLSIGGKSGADREAEEDPFGVDLTAMQRAGKCDPVIGREKEIACVAEVLLRRTKNNPVLVGAPGVGKTAIAEGLAERIVRGEVPSALKGRSVFALDLGKLLAGAKYRGDFEERLCEALKRHKEDILFLDEVHLLLSAGDKEGGMTAANLLKPLLSRGEIRVIGATTEEEYRKYIRRDGALERRFRPIAVREPSEEEAKRILRGLKARYERHHGIALEEEALDAAVEWSARYLPARYLPDKAIDLVDEAASALRLRAEEKEIRKKGDLPSLMRPLEGEKREEPPALTPEHIASTLADWTGVNKEEILRTDQERIARLIREAGADAIGAEEGRNLCERAQKREPLNFLLLGAPDKLGALVERLAKCWSASPPVLFEGKRFSDPRAAAKLFGAEGERGELLEMIAKRPSSAIVFEEFEEIDAEAFGKLSEGREEGAPLRGRAVFYVAASTGAVGFGGGKGGARGRAERFEAGTLSAIVEAN